jgi:hypothetical protein
VHQGVLFKHEVDDFNKQEMMNKGTGPQMKKHERKFEHQILQGFTHNRSQQRREH